MVSHINGVTYHGGGRGESGKVKEAEQPGTSSPLYGILRCNGESCLYKTSELIVQSTHPFLHPLGEFTIDTYCAR